MTNQPPMWQPYPGGVIERPVTPPPTRTQAVWALTLAIIPLPMTWIAAVVLSILVLNKPKDVRGSHGKRLAIAALVVVGLWIIGLIGLGASGGFEEGHRDSSGQVSQRGDVSVLSLRPGDCLVDEPNEEPQATVELIPCGQGHREEAYANFTLADGDFPGQDAIDRLAEGGCIKRFEKYIGVPASQSELEIVYLRPLKDSWPRDRGVTCLASNGTTTVGSLKGTGGEHL